MQEPYSCHAVTLNSVVPSVTLQWSKLTKVRTAPMVPGKAKAPVMSRFNKPQPTAIHVQWGT